MKLAWACQKMIHENCLLTVNMCITLNISCDNTSEDDVVVTWLQLAAICATLLRSSVLGSVAPSGKILLVPVLCWFIRG